LNDAQELIKYMKIDQEASKICSLKYFANDQNILEYVFWQTKSMKETFKTYPNIICVDATFNLNRSGYPLYIIITIDANFETRIVALGLVSSDKRGDIVKAFFQWFNDENPENPLIKTIIADKNETQLNVFVELYPTANVSLCLYHVMKSMKLESLRKIPRSALEEVRG
jgi:hypothetical protein